LAIKVLISAGPTCVPIDKVRVISNLATGETGIRLAERFSSYGAQVTLLLGGPAAAEACSIDKRIRLIRFKYSSELENLIKKELKRRRYDIMIHSAAVSDYKPSRIYKAKIKSGMSHWKINLVPTKKIIDLIKRIDKNILLVGFKFEPGAAKNTLLKHARMLLLRAKADLVVANTSDKNKYRAFIMDRIKESSPLNSKEALTKELFKLLVSKI